MSLTKFVKGSILAFVLFCLSDFLWHTYFLADFYNGRLALLNGTPEAMMGSPVYIFIFEIVAAMGMTYFILETVSKKGDWIGGALRGGLLGLMVVGGINAVNHTLLIHWDSTLAIVDIAWGVATSAIIGGILVAIFKK